MINPGLRSTINWTGSLLVLVMLFVSGCDHAPNQADRPRMDRLDLVTDADMVIHCSDISALFDAIEKSPLGRFWGSPEMASFREGNSLEDEIRLSLLDEENGENATKIRDLYLEQLKMLDGEVILGLDFSDFDGEPEITILAALSAENYQRSLEMDDLLHELEDVETIKASEDFRDTRIYTYIRKEDAGDRFIYQAFKAGTLLVSEDRPWLEQALIRLQETPAREPAGDPVLAVSSRARLMDRLQSLMVDQVRQSESPIDMRAVIKSLGIDALGDVDLRFCLQENQAHIDFQVARRGEWEKGLLVLIPSEPAPVDFRMAHVPPDIASYQVTRLDLNALWMQIPEILRQISPEFQMQFSIGVNALGGMMNINVNDDIFNNMDKLAYYYTCLGDDGQELLYGFKVKDADAMERTLGKLFAENSPFAAQIGPFYHENDVQGHVIHMLQFPVPSSDGETMAFTEIGLTVADRALLIGKANLLVDYVQAAVNNQGVPDFYESRPFKEMVARVPADACSYGWSDLSAYARFFMSEIRTAAEQMREEMATPASTGEDFRETLNPLADIFVDFDIDTLPNAEVVASYFDTSDGYSVIDDAGFRSSITIHYPKP